MKVADCVITNEVFEVVAWTVSAGRAANSRRTFSGSWHSRSSTKRSCRRHEWDPPRGRTPNATRGQGFDANRPRTARTHQPGPGRVAKRHRPLTVTLVMS